MVIEKEEEGAKTTQEMCRFTRMIARDCFDSLFFFFGNIIPQNVLFCRLLLSCSQPFWQIATEWKLIGVDIKAINTTPSPSILAWELEIIIGDLKSKNCAKIWIIRCPKATAPFAFYSRQSVMEPINLWHRHFNMRFRLKNKWRYGLPGTFSN